MLNLISLEENKSLSSMDALCGMDNDRLYEFVSLSAAGGGE
jgi:hypothetical protein